jgi:stage III sporulation protein AH
MSAKKLFALAALLLVVGSIWWLAQVRKEVERIEVVSGKPETEPEMVQVLRVPEEKVPTTEEASFFVEYRLQREQTRARETEMLNQIIENEKISEEGKRQAEQQLLSLIALMEKELLVENLVKAKGYRDAIFFYRDGLANVVVAAESLSEREVVQLAEMVSGLAGIRMEEVAVVKHGN